MDSASRKEQVLRNLWGNQTVDQKTLPVTPYIAEELVEGIKAIDLKDIGSSQWYSHHEVVQQLNLHAHQQATAATDEFIVDTLVTGDKIYHEALLVNLLEVLLYHKTAAQAADAHLVDLVDYINRRVVDITQLHSPSPSLDTGVQLPSDEEELERQETDCQYKICMTCLSILRFLTDHRGGLPVTVTSRLLDQHDIILSLVSLMERKPWYRPRPNGEREFFEDHQYEMTTYRRDTLLRLRRHLNETVHDQIPPLMDLHRVLEQLAITGQHPEEKHRIPPILVELSAEVRETLLERYAGKWDEIADEQKEVFSKTQKDDLSRLSNSMMSLPLDSVTSRRCRTCGRHADQRCAKCKVEWYCSRECQISDWRSHKEVCRAVSSPPT
ncbi:putative zinc finger MYND domain-containing protein [Neospora caninum Liverpool]|uniref:Putative zinc finger MYND domain-containing protein n=1 Tax=Neospora caninum (strain Liverpool) TaxID=572307 RepID=F0VLG0_NEOCL|nr:putative zinc finger MYND domain-containing protein [Neospora caninum Liverpool]CBZ54088.1 putative zinc finger MYND domain-containing protein [Neospora caninum Liverpool]CEL68786.1 TPA: zinc finger MYND domain-containing protein,putative [Neospora caninum Liverpool]|eukprot:XP_003884119.1 putative zinc finger MYND domain-containing protein [Neospora caninum Liverpool]